MVNVLLKMLVELLLQIGVSPFEVESLRFMKIQTCRFIPGSQLLLCRSCFFQKLAFVEHMIER